MYTYLGLSVDLDILGFFLLVIFQWDWVRMKNQNTDMRTRSLVLCVSFVDRCLSF